MALLGKETELKGTGFCPMGRLKNMTDRAEIECLLNQTGRTLEGLPNSYSVQEVDYRFEGINAW